MEKEQNKNPLHYSNYSKNSELYFSDNKSEIEGIHIFQKEIKNKKPREKSEIKKASPIFALFVFIVIVILVIGYSLIPIYFKVRNNSIFSISSFISIILFVASITLFDLAISNKENKSSLILICLISLIIGLCELATPLLVEFSGLIEDSFLSLKVVCIGGGIQICILMPIFFAILTKEE